MKVILVTAVDAAWSQQLLSEVHDVAACDRFRVHEVVEDADEADILLFVDAHQYPSDWRMRNLSSHPLVRAHPEKAFVYDERDLPRDLLPGVYVAMPQPMFDPRRQRAFGYYRLITDTRGVREQAPDLLFSFQGRRAGGRLRDRVLGLSHPRAVVEDTSGRDFFDGGALVELDDARRGYLDVLGRSKFVLCPRGAGTASIRLFEALAAGRVPVVISDDWVPPAGIDWDACAARVPEADVEAVFERLAALEERWPAMGEAARRTYDEWFAPDVWFHRVIDLCGEILAGGEVGVARQWTSLQTWRDGARTMRARVAERRA